MALNDPHFNWGKAHPGVERERVKMGTGRQEGVDRDKTCMVCVKPNQSF